MTFLSYLMRNPNRIILCVFACASSCLKEGNARFAPSVSQTCPPCHSMRNPNRIILCGFACASSCLNEGCRLHTCQTWPFRVGGVSEMVSAGSSVCLSQIVSSDPECDTNHTTVRVRITNLMLRHASMSLDWHFVWEVSRTRALSHTLCGLQIASYCAGSHVHRH
jgi:hypothetical protein